MGRAFSPLEAAFYDSGGVLSAMTCTREPSRPRIERSRLATRPFTGALSLGVSECIELGGYDAALDDDTDLTDYASYELR